MVIYEPQGKAGEYAHLCCNLYSGGCPHKCVYCYVPSAIQKTRQQWRLEPCYPRKDILKLLRKEAPKYYGTNKRIHLCFTCDPYNPIEKSTEITRQALMILRDNKIPFQVLTKGGKLAERDFNLYGPEDIFGVTLTCNTDEGSLRYEPGAPPTSERIETLQIAHDHGIKTWVSFEPVLSAESSLSLIENLLDIVDHFKLGTLNHCKVGCPADNYRQPQWSSYAIKAIWLLEKSKSKPTYFIKEDLRKHIPNVVWNQTDARSINRVVITKKEGLFA